MADIHKASRVVDRDLRFREQDGQVQAEKQQIIEQLRHGNIHEVFARQTKFKVSDFTDFFSTQWRNFQSQIVQDAEIKAGEASFHPPSVEDFPVHHQGVTISPEEGALFGKAMVASLGKGAGAGAGAGSGFGKFKASTVDAASSSSDAEPLTSEELGAIGEGAVAEWDQFLDDTWGTIFDAQLTQEMQRKMGEVKAEVQRMITLAKEGKIGVEFVLVALAKVNQTKNGVLMSGLGKKMYKINEDMNRMSQDLYSMDQTNPNYYANLQLTQSKTRDGSFQLNLLTQDMQKVMQDTASTIESVHSMIGEINRTRREIISQIKG
jgi:hypothetical protein